MTLAKNGGGICQSFHYIVADDLKQSRFSGNPQDYTGQTRPYSMVLFAESDDVSNGARLCGIL